MRPRCTTFYAWTDPGEMARFLVGGAGFERIVRSFGRVSVPTWLVVGAAAGPARASVPRAASRLLTALPVDDDADGSGLGLAARIECELDQVDALARHHDLHTAVIGLDPRRWELLRFALWAEAVPAGEAATERYEVLHNSAPCLGDLPSGRTW